MQAISGSSVLPVTKGSVFAGDPHGERAGEQRPDRQARPIRQRRETGGVRYRRRLRHQRRSETDQLGAHRAPCLVQMRRRDPERRDMLAEGEQGGGRIGPGDEDAARPSLSRRNDALPFEQPQRLTQRGTRHLDEPPGQPPTGSSVISARNARWSTFIDGVRGSASNRRIATGT